MCFGFTWDGNHGYLRGHGFQLRPAPAMNRSELVESLVARVDDMTHRDAESAVSVILEAVSDALAHGRRIEIRGFGVLSVVRRPTRIGRNPRSGERVVVPEKRALHFKPGKALRDGVDDQI